MRGKVQLSLLQLQPRESVGDAAAWASTPGSARHLLFQQGPWQQGPSISSRGAGSVNFYVSYSQLAQIFFFNLFNFGRPVLCCSSGFLELR